MNKNFRKFFSSKFRVLFQYALNKASGPFSIQMKNLVFRRIPNAILTSKNYAVANLEKHLGRTTCTLLRPQTLSIRHPKRQTDVTDSVPYASQFPRPSASFVIQRSGQIPGSIA